VRLLRLKAQNQARTAPKKSKIKMSTCAAEGGPEAV
jgi:hypothetical protein